MYRFTPTKDFINYLNIVVWIIKLELQMGIGIANRTPPICTSMAKH